MALITCPECGREISDKAAACPHCGFPIQEHLRAQTQNQTNTYSILLDVVGGDLQKDELRRILRLTDAQIDAAISQVLATHPAVLAENLTKDEAEKLVGQFTYPHHFKIRSAEGIDTSVPGGQSPMTFESTIGAVILGVIAAILILSFL